MLRVQKNTALQTGVFIKKIASLQITRVGGTVLVTFLVGLNHLSFFVFSILMYSF